MIRYHSNLIRATKQSNVAVLAGAICHAIRNTRGTRQTIAIQAIGVNAAYNALKAAIIARGNLEKEGIVLLMTGSFVPVEIEGEERTAIRLEFVAKRKREVRDAATP